MHSGPPPMSMASPHTGSHVVPQQAPILSILSDGSMLGVRGSRRRCHYRACERASAREPSLGDQNA